MKKLLAATTALALLGGVTTAQAASTASGALFDILANPGNTGTPDAQLIFEDNNWSFDPGAAAVQGDAAALLLGIGSATPATALFNISGIGGSNSTVLDPAAPIDFGTTTPGSDFGIFGSIKATSASSTTNGLGAITSIILTGITAEMRFIDGAAAPLIDASTATGSALVDFGTTSTVGFSAAIFDDSGSDSFYTLFVDSTVGSTTFGKIIGFELGLDLMTQSLGPKFLPGVLSNGKKVDLFGKGNLIYNQTTGVAATTGLTSDFIVGDADFSLNAIPTPAAAGASLGMMALLAFRRRQKA